MKTYGECTYNSTLLDLDTKREWSASRPDRFIPGDITSGTKLDIMLGRPQSRCGRCGKQKDLLPLSGIEPRSSSP
jgi:hypothetical protein